MAAALENASAIADEVVISDGGSSDQTLVMARDLGARVVTGPPGRGGQLNRGARQADGDVLLFLHADTRLPPEARDAIANATAGNAVGGAFRAAYDDPRWSYRVASTLINRRAQWTGCPLGDQAQFARRDAWEAVGGFPEWPILEDLDFIRRLKRHGRVVILSETVTTSARRVRAQGFLRGVLTNYLIWGLYFAGISPHRLARLYHSIR